MNEPQNELLWTAFRYSAGELSATEAGDFELRLADDQAAREALATAVGLTETVVAIERMAPAMAELPMPASSSQFAPSRSAWSRSAWSGSGSSRSLGWVAFVAAACIGLMFVGQSFLGNGFGPQDTPPVAPAQVAAAKMDLLDADSQLLAAMLDGAQSDDELTGEHADDAAASSFIAGIAYDEHRDYDENQESVGPESEPLFDVSGLDGPNQEDQNATPDWLFAAVAESKS